MKYYVLYGKVSEVFIKLKREGFSIEDFVLTYSGGDSKHTNIIFQGFLPAWNLTVYLDDPKTVMCFGTGNQEYAIYDMLDFEDCSSHMTQDEFDSGLALMLALQDVGLFPQS